jgi:hypothetical protein
VSVERFLAVEDGQPIKYSELASLIALALHPNQGAEYEYGAARINLDEDLAAAVRDGRLVVRNAADMGRHTAPHGNALQNAVLLPHDLQPFLQERGIELRLTPQGNGPHLWTLDNVAIALAEQEGWHNGTRGSFLDRLVEAGTSGELCVRDPHTDLPYRPKVVRTFWELVTPADVNTWLEKQRVNYRWNGHPKMDAAINYVSLSDAAERLEYTDERLLQKLALDSVPVHVLLVGEVSEASGEAAGAIKCFPPLSMVELAYIRANGSTWIGGATLLQRLPAIGLPGGKLDDEVLRRVVAPDATFTYKRRLSPDSLIVTTSDLLVSSDDLNRMSLARRKTKPARSVEEVPDASRPAASARLTGPVTQSTVPASVAVWTDDRREEARAMLERLKGQGSKAFAAETAKAFNVSTARLREVLKEKKAKARTKLNNSAFNWTGSSKKAK